MLKLFHRTELIGLIRNANQDGFEMSGEIELTPAAAAYKDVFAFFTDEQKALYEEPPFAGELLEHWSVETESGERKEIVIPGVYEDGGICWRYG